MSRIPTSFLFFSAFDHPEMFEIVELQDLTSNTAKVQVKQENAAYTHAKAAFFAEYPADPTTLPGDEDDLTFVDNGSVANNKFKKDDVAINRGSSAPLIVPKFRMADVVSNPSYLLVWRGQSSTGPWDFTSVQVHFYLEDGIRRPEPDEIVEIPSAGSAETPVVVFKGRGGGVFDSAQAKVFYAPPSASPDMSGASTINTNAGSDALVGTVTVDRTKASKYMHVMRYNPAYLVVQRFNGATPEGGVGTERFWVREVYLYVE